MGSSGTDLSRLDVEHAVVWLMGELEWKGGPQKTQAVLGVHESLVNNGACAHLNLAELEKLHFMVGEAIIWVKQEEAKAKASGLA